MTFFIIIFEIYKRKKKYFLINLGTPHIKKKKKNILKTPCTKKIKTMHTKENK